MNGGKGRKGGKGEKGERRIGKEEETHLMHHVARSANDERRS